MQPELLEADRLARNALATDYESTLFVDAGAGTGKTTAIVSRIAETGSLHDSGTISMCLMGIRRA